jgi:hypothetical protein
MFRSSVLGNQPAHDRTHFAGIDLTIHVDASALPSVFIEDMRAKARWLDYNLFS